MQILSSACEELPTIALNRIRWVQSATSDIKDENINAPVAANTAPAAQANPSLSSDPTRLLQVGFVNAEIKGFTGDYRAALNTVSQFASRLRANPAVESVLILQEPVNVSSFANLQGSTTDEGMAERPPALFKLKIVLKQAINPTANNGVAP